jgi:hypothetical protein
MKLQIKEMFENAGKDADGNTIKRAIGTLYCESVEGRVGELLEEHGEAFIAALVDCQVLHHPASAAFKSKGGKNDNITGLDRLPKYAKESQQLYVHTKEEAAKLGFDVTEVPDGERVVLVNWDFKPGQSAAAVKAAEAAREKEATIQRLIAGQLDLLTATGQEVTEELREKVAELVRGSFK